MQAICEPSLSPAEIAKRHGVEKGTVYDWIHRGVTRPDGTTIKLEAYAIGKLYRVEPAALEAFIAACSGRLRRKRGSSGRAQKAVQEFRERTGLR